MRSSTRNNSLIDITRRIDEKREPRASDISLRNVITRNADGIIIVDRYGITRFANPAAESLFGRRAEELLATEFGFPFVAGGTTEINIVCKDGEPAVAEMRVVEVEWEGEICYLASLRDITERKRAEQQREQLIREQEARKQAEEANRIKDEFLATVSHELRTPLTSILGWARMLGTGKLDSETTLRAIKSIERNAKAQAEIINDLLDVSRIVTGKLHLNIHRVDPVPIIRGALGSIRPSADAKQITIQLRFDLSVGPILADADRIQQVVWNLLSNAVKFTPNGGTVEVKLERIDNRAEITVSDNGKGIRTEFLPHIYDHFYQADGSLTRTHGGLGMGLAIVRHLVELHGGTVDVESQGEGQGARFKVRLPLAQ